MNKYRKIVELSYYFEGMEDGWETVRGIGKLNREYISGLVKKYCGKSLIGKTFRFAYMDLTEGRYWIKPMNFDFYLESERSYNMAKV